MPLRQQGVGWDAELHFSTVFRWGGIFLCSELRRSGWQYLPLPFSFQAVFDLVRKGTTAAGAGMGANTAVIWGCTNAETSLLPGRGVTLVPGWWALLKTGRLGCRASVCAFPPRTHTSEIYVLADCVSVFKWPSLAGRVNHCQPLRNWSAGAKALGRGTAWLKCAWAWGVPEEQAAWDGWENWWESRKMAVSF